MEPEPGSIVGPPPLPPILWLKVPFSLVQPTSLLILRLYAKRSGHPDIPIGTHQMQVPAASKTGSFYLQSSLFNRLNVSHAVVPCVLENNVGETAQSTQPVTLYISINITPPNLHNNPSRIPTEDELSPTEETTIPGRIQFPAPKHLSPLSHHQSAEAGDSKPQSCDEASPVGTKDLRSALNLADQAMKGMDRSNTWQGAVGRIKWLMDTLGPIAEVRTIPFCGLRPS